MSPLSLPSNEPLSALADGQLTEAELERVLEVCAHDEHLHARWRDYHLIGEALRGRKDLLAASSPEADFLARLRPALQRSPTLAVPMREAANQPAFRGRWLAAAAVLALAVVLASTGPGGWATDEEMALGEAPVLAASPHGVIVRDAALQELLEAHRQQADASVQPMPSGFLRNATFNTDPAGPPGQAR